MRDFKEQEQEKWADVPGYVQSFTALGKVYSRPWRYAKNSPESVDIEPKTMTVVKYIMRDKETGAALIEFSDMRKVSEFLRKPVNVIQGTICQCYMGKRPTAYGYKWERIETKEMLA